ncbi:MAG: diacylglycerol kinase family protein [Bacteroidales bacterium]|nr:diacylglycerol kinase family protein [Bacteroidales bacterium]
MKKKNNKFSIKSRIKSFDYAFQGILFFIKTQHNARIHLLMAIVVVVFGFIYELCITEWCLIIFAIGMVFSTEIINTALEYVSDLVSPEKNLKVKRIKDLAAGGVLISAITAAIIGLIIFIPKIF